MTPEETAAAVKDSINSLGRAFMTSRATLQRGAELGLEGWPFYVAGRGGVLGEVDADVVAAALVFCPRDWVRRHWDAATSVMKPAEATRFYAEACQEWGRRKLDTVEDADRLAALLERVASSGDPAGRALFAGWRALPLPDDAPARLSQLFMVLREHRGNGHAVCVLAAGLSPLEAIVASPRGFEGAAFFEWPEPYPDPEPFRQRWQAAEEATGRLTAPTFAVLDEAEREELGRLVHAAAAAARAR
jgi:hypothetical protein